MKLNQDHPEQETVLDSWAIVEIMGHRQFAGRISECEIAGTPFLRIDVPGVGDAQPFTKYFGSGAIYAITPVTEQAARLYAERLRVQPIDIWQLPAMARAVLDGEQGGLPFAESFSATEDDDVPW